MRSLSWLAAAVIGGACLTSCVANDTATLATADQEIRATCSPSFPQVAINPDKELVIRDLSVVEDPCRTTWTATGCAANTLGRWTFGRLMAVMAGTTDVDSAQARMFVARWLKLWMAPQTVGADPTPVAARTGISQAMLTRWLADSGCSTVTDPTLCPTFDLKAAPLRLLAVVNRIDLDGRGYDGTTGVPGELRFAFGAFSRGTAALAAINMTAILEYKLPATRAPIQWASSFHGLAATPFGPSFASQLQAITDLVVEPQASGPNRSSINQVRTNESAFDPATSKQWEFRQFGLACATTPCNLAQVAVSQTPATALNRTATLTTWLTANRTAASTSTHVVPVALLGGSSLSPPSPNFVVWNTADDGGHAKLVDPTSPTLSYNVRHNFAFNTCNGCHYAETANTKLFHIKPRNPGSVAALSPFLTSTLDTANGLYPTDYISVDDPNLDSYDSVNDIPLTFEYNEIWRRTCEVRRVLAGVRLPWTTPTGHDAPPAVPPPPMASPF